jgi:hypothetical protein
MDPLIAVVGATGTGKSKVIKQSIPPRDTQLPSYLASYITSYHPQLQLQFQLQCLLLTTTASSP